MGELPRSYPVPSRPFPPSPGYQSSDWPPFYFPIWFSCVTLSALLYPLLYPSMSPSMSFSTAGAGTARAARMNTFTKDAALPASNSPAEAQVIPRNLSP